MLQTIINIAAVIGILYSAYQFYKRRDENDYHEIAKWMSKITRFISKTVLYRFHIIIFTFSIIVFLFSSLALYAILFVGLPLWVYWTTKNLATLNNDEYVLEIVNDLAPMMDIWVFIGLFAPVIYLMFMAISDHKREKTNPYLRLFKIRRRNRK